jgi:hypothetical protein
MCKRGWHAAHMTRRIDWLTELAVLLAGCGHLRPLDVLPLASEL